MTTSESSTPATQPAATPGIGAVHHLSLTVRDVEASAAWYQRTLGLMKIMEEEHEGGHAVIMMHPSGQLFLGVHAHDKASGDRFDETRTGLDHVSFTVPTKADLEAWEARLREQGVHYSPIYQRDYGYILVFRDPDNIQLEFINPIAAG